MTARTITHTLMVDITASSVGPDSRMPMHLRYSPDEPIPVHLHFGDGREWLFARDLLIRGLNEATGVGDVRVWPAGTRMYVRLSSPDGTCLLSMDLPQVRRFVAHTWRLVPPGRETVDVEAWISGLLDGAL